MIKFPSIKGVFRRKVDEEFTFPTYIGPENDKANICNDFKHVGEYMRKAMNEIKNKE